MVSQKHPFHLVDPSPWPLVSSTFLLLSITTGVLYLHNYSGVSFLFFSSFTFLFFVFCFWWRDVIREGTFEGQHSSTVQFCLRLSILLFIVSEVMFFFSFFWLFFWVSLSPTPEIGGIWPPMGLKPLSTFELPLLNTTVLLLSGFSVTWCHHSIISGSKMGGLISLFLTLVLASFFTVCQLVEYFSSSFSISDGIYGSVFFTATGFHGFHVFIGTVFLLVSFIRIYFNHFTKQHHFGFEAAAWYWHFVDVVWLFLFISIYWWGGSI